jgi:hypothetical protein
MIGMDPVPPVGSVIMSGRYYNHHHAGAVLVLSLLLLHR